MVVAIALILAGYLVGSIASAVLTCRIMGFPDPRAEGSGNPGTTNVLRLAGTGAAVITLVGDMLKGLLPVLLASAVAPSPWTVAATGLAAFIGHLYPIFFGFKGGKGVATALGVLCGFSWLIGAAVLGTWLVVAVALRYSSLSALVAALLAPCYAILVHVYPAYVFGIAIMSILLIWRHRSNIQKLIAGEESKIGDKPAL